MATDLATQYQNNQSIYSREDAAWRTFVFDHRNILIAKSTLVHVNQRLLHQYRHRIWQLLTAIGVPKSIHWIVLWLNGYDANTPVSQLQHVRVITEESVIEDLHSSYLSWKRNVDNN